MADKAAIEEIKRQIQSSKDAMEDYKEDKKKKKVDYSSVSSSFEEIDEAIEKLQNDIDHNKELLKSDNPTPDN